MARPPSPLNELAAHAALDYIERALRRRANVFTVPRDEASETFFKLQAARARTPEWLESANAWFSTHLTASGRAKMLGALRRRRAGASQMSTTMRLPRATHAELASLATKLEVSPSAALAGMLAAVRRDKQLQSAVKQFVAARSSNHGGAGDHPEHGHHEHRRQGQGAVQAASGGEPQ